MILLFGAAFVAASSFVQAQKPDFYAAVSKLPWDSAKQGPLIAVCPPKLVRWTTLDGVNRKLAKVGGLTSVVPKEMTTIDSRVKVAPNFYDGLPEGDKVLYLLHALSPAQWRKASEGGLTIADCKGEQVAVFNSIVPNPLSYSTATVASPYRVVPSDKGTTVGEAERSKVKLRVVRQLKLELVLKDDSGTTVTNVPGDAAIGQEVPVLGSGDDAAFGQKFLTTSPNESRKSDLDLANARLAAILPLQSGETIRALFGRISAATGITLVADPHYVSMPIYEVGARASARDLLAAISLGVAGTFRRLGNTYILTSDLEGIGSHEARIALWQDGNQQIVDELEEKWRREVAKSGGLRSAKFNSPAFGNLTPDELTNLENNDRPDGTLRYLSTSKSSEAVRNAVKNFKASFEIDRERVGITSTVRYEIVLPNGQKAWGSSTLGSTDEFTDQPPLPTPAPEFVKLPLKVPAGIVFHSDTPAQVKKLVARVAELGIKDLWVETSDAATLAAAVESGAGQVKISLAIRPWAIAAGDASAVRDRNIVGDPVQGDSTLLHRFWEQVGAFEPTKRESIDMLGDPVLARTARADKLALTEGLAGVMVLDLYPTGYAKTRTRAFGSPFYTRATDAYLALGYTEAQRADFLRIGGADPVDLENDSLQSRIQTSRVWGDAVVPPGDFDQWQKAKGAWAHAAALRLVKTLASHHPGFRVLVPGQPNKTQLPPYPAAYLFDWKVDAELPTNPEEYGEREIVKYADVQVWEVQDEHDLLLRNRVATSLKAVLEQAEKPVILDFSSVPYGHLQTVMTRWLGSGLEKWVLTH